LENQATLLNSTWEAIHAPYDQPTYQAVLDWLRAEDVILDIGAGDLRLARQMARRAQKVYAVEIDAQVLSRTAVSCGPLPLNLILIHADARLLDFPSGVTTGVLLMRHCTCFQLYARKLKQAGAARLITNARWRMNVETVDLLRPPVAFAQIQMGWYACSCGSTGFKEGPAEYWSLEQDRMTHEVASCPHCLQSRETTSMESL
jgi:tRNA G46 methylase TrmB